MTLVGRRPIEVKRSTIPAAMSGPARGARSRPKPWTVDELTAWLRLALSDRFAALWLLAATTGLHRSELAGVDRAGYDTDHNKLVRYENGR